VEVESTLALSAQCCCSRAKYTYLILQLMDVYQYIFIKISLGHKFKEAEKVNVKYEPGPWYGASLGTKKLVPPYRYKIVTIFV